MVTYLSIYLFIYLSPYSFIFYFIILFSLYFNITWHHNVILFHNIFFQSKLISKLSSNKNEHESLDYSRFTLWMQNDIEVKHAFANPVGAWVRSVRAMCMCMFMCMYTLTLTELCYVVLCCVGEVTYATVMLFLLI